MGLSYMMAWPSAMGGGVKFQPGNTRGHPGTSAWLPGITKGSVLGILFAKGDTWGSQGMNAWPFGVNQGSVLGILFAKGDTWGFKGMSAWPLGVTQGPMLGIRFAVGSIWDSAGMSPWPPRVTQRRVLGVWFAKRKHKRFHRNECLASRDHPGISPWNLICKREHLGFPRNECLAPWGQKKVSAWSLICKKTWGSPGSPTRQCLAPWCSLQNSDLSVSSYLLRQLFLTLLWRRKLIIRNNLCQCCSSDTVARYRTSVCIKDICIVVLRSS